MDATDRPLVFDIVRGSVADGDGIRTVVFLKGCPMGCAWCHNPESQDAGVTWLYRPERCVKCGKCAAGCDYGARVSVGRHYAPDELAEIVLRDRFYYESSNGGITFSGGEPLLYIDYVASIARAAKKQGVHVLVETAGCFSLSHFERALLPYVDTVFFDLKIFNEELHRLYTGRSNREILGNFRGIIRMGITVLPRIPLIPTAVANEENLAQLANFLKECSVSEYSLLTYNASCVDKRKYAGFKNDFPFLEKPMGVDEENRWRSFFAERMRIPCMSDSLQG